MIIAAIKLEAGFVAFLVELYCEFFILQDCSRRRMCWRGRCGCGAASGTYEGGRARTRGHGGVQMTTGYSMSEILFVWSRR